MSVPRPITSERLRRMTCVAICPKCKNEIARFRQRDVNAEPQTHIVLIQQAGRKHAEHCAFGTDVTVEVQESVA